MKKILILLAVGVIFLTLNACGAENDNTSTEMADESIVIEGTNYTFDQESYTIPAGVPVTIQFKNQEGVHGIKISELDVDIKKDGRQTITVEEPGEYLIYCNLPCGTGHDDMVASLIVK
ncbi:cupredoxin domain-containing protein [Saliterribacillus persicus]|uniref:Cytochrome c oxidase subunit 2 n=1 Tax=Saliterribacillus persicus TaxID=930114 RepID=A0A368Y0X7_9BACI|nr:cupredoxin domain-containing protein [Saliterribacillus persicus]RCW73046.1 cytochrome c oxidase subunit 2 [Saliterribacillus persicus]